MLCSASLDCTYYFEEQIGKFTPKDKIKLANLLVSSAVNLPEFFKIQPEFGFFLAAANKQQRKTGFMFGLQRQVTLPIIKTIDLKVFVLFFYHLTKLFIFSYHFPIILKKIQ